VINNLRTTRYQFKGLWFWKVERELINDATGVVDLNTHLIPEDAITIRSGEYGLDPADPHLALDLILHEPHIESPPEIAHLFTAPTVPDALAAHRADVTTVRARFGHGAFPAARAGRDRVIADMAAQISIDPVAHELVGLRVQRERAEVQSGGGGQPSAGSLRSRLLKAERNAREGK
jgi:hypothetical protein